MNKKELIFLLLIPVYAIAVTYYGIYQSNMVANNQKATVDIVKQSDDLILKIKSENPEVTQRNLANHIIKAKSLLVVGLENEKLYIDAMYAFFRETLIFSVFWFLSVLFIFNKSKKRNA